jgi:hypothetical protein
MLPQVRLKGQMKLVSSLEQGRLMVGSESQIWFSKSGFSVSLH